MPVLQTNTFTTYSLSVLETLSASVLSIEQKCLFQTDLALIAEQRLALDIDFSNPTKFAQDEAFLKGQMSILRVMLLRSEESEIQLKTMAVNS